jgi:hypothetical protein
MKAMLLTLALICMLAIPVFSQPTYNVGDPVEDFTLLNAQSQPVSMSDYPDRIICLVFWTSD